MPPPVPDAAVEGDPMLCITIVTTVDRVVTPKGAGLLTPSLLGLTVVTPDDVGGLALTVLCSNVVSFAIVALVAILVLPLLDPTVVSFAVVAPKVELVPPLVLVVMATVVAGGDVVDVDVDVEPAEVSLTAVVVVLVVVVEMVVLGMVPGSVATVDHTFRYPCSPLSQATLTRTRHII